MKSSTLKKLKQYSSFAGIVAASTTAASGQIIYTDVNPDLTVSGNGSLYGLDLDNDGNADFLFLTIDTAIIYASLPVDVKEVAAFPYQSGNQIAGSLGGSASTLALPFALSAGNQIGTNLAWNTAGTEVMAAGISIYSLYNVSYGNFVGAQDKFIGLKFLIGGNTHYGWARFDVADSSNHFTIKDYAYDGVTNNSILAGAMTNSTGGILQPKEIAIYSFEKKINVIFKDNQFFGGTITIENILGQEIKSENINAQVMHMDMNDVVAGTYIVMVKGNDGSVVSKKVFLN